MSHKAIQSGCILSQDTCRLLEQNELTRGVYPTHYGIFIRAQGRCERLEGIDTHVLILCEGGQGVVRYNEVEKKIQPGDILLIPANTPHAYGSIPGLNWSINWTHFAGSEALAFFKMSKNTEIQIFHSSELQLNKIQAVFHDYYGCISRDLKINTLIAASQILRHLLGLICFSDTGSEASEYTRRAVEKTINLMQLKLDRQLSLRQLASAAGLSASRFSVLFKAETGLSPIEYFNNLKVRRACQYLDTTEMSIGSISSLVGIDNQHYFSRLFSKNTGISPREYRKLKLQL